MTRDQPGKGWSSVQCGVTSRRSTSEGNPARSAAVERDFPDGGGIRQGGPCQPPGEGGEPDGVLPGGDSGKSGRFTGEESPLQLEAFQGLRVSKRLSREARGETPR